MTPDQNNIITESFKSHFSKPKNKANEVFQNKIHEMSEKISEKDRTISNIELLHEKEVAALKSDHKKDMDFKKL